MSKIYWLDIEIATIHINDEEEAICICGRTFLKDIKEVDGKPQEWYSLKKHFIEEHLTIKKKVRE
jgi:hypothetical protein